MVTANDLRGIITPIVTPLTEDENVDYDALRRVVHHVVDGGVHAVFTGGSTGNACSFTSEERLQIARTVIQEVKGRVPVFAGCLETNTRLVIQTARRAAEIGADAVVVEAPFYFICSANDVLTHFQAVAAASPLPVIAYNNPENTQARIDLELTKTLADIPNIIGMKDSTYDFSYFQSLLRAFEGQSFCVLQGQEPLVGASFLLGARAAVLALSNVAPRLCVQLFEAGRAGKIDETRALQWRLMQVAQICKYYSDDPALSGDNGKETTSSWLAGLEAGMSLVGVCKRIVPTPHQRPTSTQLERARALLTRAWVR